MVLALADVPVERHRACRLLRKVEHVLARAQLLLRMAQLGDVLLGAEHPARPAGGVANHVALAVDDAHFAVRADDAEFDVVARPAVKRRRHRGERSRAVLRVDEREPAFAPLRKISRALVLRDAENAPALFGEHHAVRHQVALPVPEVRDALRLLQPRLARAQLVFRLPQLGDVLHDAELANGTPRLVARTSPWLCTARTAPSGLTTRYSTS